MRQGLFLCIKLALVTTAFAFQSFAQDLYRLENASWETGTASVAARFNVPLGRDQCPSGYCDGIYSFKLNVDPELAKDFKNLAIFIPAIGGVQDIAINDRIYPSGIDYSSVGPVLELPQAAASTYRVKIHIRAPLTDFTGIWKSAPQVGELSDLLRTQRHVELVQIYTPLIEAVVSFVFSVLFGLFYVLLKRRVKAYRNFGIALSLWAIFYFFLSGIPREIDFRWGSILHYPAREMAVIGTFLIFLRLPIRKPLPVKAYLGLFFTAAFISFIFGVLQYPYEQRIVHVIASVVPFSILFLYRFDSKDLTAKLLFCFGVVCAIGHVSDSIKLLEIFNYNYPLPFLNRWTTPPLLFVAFTDCVIQYSNYFHQLRTHLFKANSYARVVLRSAKEGLSHKNVEYFLKIAGRICGYKRVSLAQRNSDGTYRVVKLYGSKNSYDGSLIDEKKSPNIQTAISRGEIVFGSVVNVGDSWSTSAFAVVPVPEQKNPPYLLLLSDPKTSESKIKEFVPYLSQISSAIWTNLERTREQDLNYFAAQIAHDIRSPLATLNAIVHNSEGVNESVRGQIKGVVARIRDIANNLLRPKSTGSYANLSERPSKETGQADHIYGSIREVNEVDLISHRIYSIVSEKIIQYSDCGGVEISITEFGKAMPYFANIQKVEFGRVLSNLIDNSIEAVGECGKVIVHLKGDDHHIQICVEDSGMGMDPDVLSKLGSRGFSYGKTGKHSGTGLGVYHAMQTIQAWGGQLEYSSERGAWTKAVITLPRVKPPVWFADSISVVPGSTVIVLDDDPSTHEVWKERFRSAGLKDVQVVWFAKGTDLIQWYRGNLGEVGRSLYLCTYELAQGNHTGLEVIEMLGLAGDAVLMTDQWDDEQLRQRCERFKVRILPKTVHVPVQRQTHIGENV
ncbi:MAG: ATP-binding protein [Bdellovibrionia bacterium]